MRARRIETSETKRSEARPPTAEAKRSEACAPPLEVLMDALSSQERRFVLALLDSGDPMDAAKAAPWRDERTVAEHLDHDAVRSVLLRLAPLLPDRAKGRKILAPYALQRQAQLIERGSEAQAAAAAQRVLEANGDGAISAGDARTEALRLLASEAARRTRALPPAPTVTVAPLPQRDEP